MNSVFLLVIIFVCLACSDEKPVRSGSGKAGAVMGKAEPLPTNPVTGRPYTRPDRGNDENSPESGSDSSDQAEASEEPPILGVDTNNCYKADSVICEIERTIAAETNRLRATAGKPPLAHGEDHAYVARTWSESMAVRGKISHDGFPSLRQAAFRTEFGSTTSYRAENVAMNYDRENNPESIGKKFAMQWWNSPGHKTNMLGQYRFLGAGVARQGDSYYATQLFTD